MSPARFLIAIVMLCPLCSSSQHMAHAIIADDDQPFPQLSKRGLHIGDTVFILRGNCKSNGLALFTRPKQYLIRQAQAKEKSDPFLTVHGNILYNFTYRSYIDTPFAQNDLQQHLVQTTLSFTIKNKYPIRMVVTNRSSNSPYFKNTTDISLQFNRRYMLENIKADLRRKAENYIRVDIPQAEQLYTQQQLQVQQLQAWISSPARVQELIEERERKLNIKKGTQLHREVPLFGKGTYTNPSGSKEAKQLLGRLRDAAEDSIMKAVAGKKPAFTDSSFATKLEQRKKELAKLQQEMKKNIADARKLRKTVLDSVNAVKKEINGLSTTAGLYAFMKKNGIPKTELSNAQRLLLSVNQVGIGRSWVDYSELTVKNISLAGINVEANPLPFYIAFAAGKVNYRFRDFIIKDNKQLPDQSLYLVRAGIGQKEKNNLIFTFYNGKKAVLNYTPANDPASVQRVLGISAEARFALNENNYIVAEVAKSSFNHAGAQPPSSELVSKALNFKIRSNEAFSIKLYSQNPQTDTRLTGYYRKTGEDFQSFNLYPVNTRQDAWMARVSQNFWKRKLNIDAAIRKNDFTSPLAAPSFSSQAIFKSLQVSLRIPKYPFVSVGYYPSSQLSLSNNNVLMENQYNTFNAIMNYSYRFKKLGMNTNALYTRFYNSGSDTGFIYYNAGSWTLNHSIFLSPFMLQASAGVTKQQDLCLFTLEQLLSYQYKNILTLSGSLKWNRLNHIETLIGGTAGIGISIKRIGTVQLNYDKTFLPGYNRVLKPVDIGRAAFYREF